ncbi:hypothetical protein SPD48_15435 [Pseudogracilibacillus sp. SE30717A]|uniref:hypothetical protein n=1 Tax=Pseudogracilibacillus sp. SE30717A TaxID=3098293 RepID=UPI00300E6896
MGTVTVTGAIVVIIGWLSLVEYDNFPETKKRQIVQKIKRSPAYIGLIALMPVGIIVNVIGSFVGSVWMVILGASLIFLQGIIVSLLFWKRKRWKSIFLLTVIIALGIFIYIPLFI